MRKSLFALLLGAAAAAVAATSVALANGDRHRNSFRANLNGFNEVVGGPGAASTGSISTRARGTFHATLRSNPARLVFRLTYSGMEGGTVIAAHPHFAQQHVGGGVFTHLCGGPKPACPTPGGTVEGEILASDIVGPTDQGVEAGAFGEFVRALRAGAVYVNVHSTNFPEGEIRGQVRLDD
jgi:CHRD domain-containing protein